MFEDSLPSRDASEPVPGNTIKQKREAYVFALDAAIGSIVKQLSQIPEVERAILFGSYAAGRRDLFTDLDLLIVMDSELDFIRRTAD